MSYRFNFLIFNTFLFLSTINPVHAYTFDTFADFQQAIKNTVQQSMHLQPDEELEVNLLQVSPGMQLPTCSIPFTITLTQPGVSAPSNTVMVKCDDASQNILYVPVQLKLMVDVLAASRRIMPGETISAEDIIVQKGDKYLLYNEYMQDKEAAVGLIAMRSIPAGGILSKRSLNKPLYIKRNQTMSLSVKHGTIEISMLGIAKTDGHLNESVKVMNPNSQKIIDAIVTGPGKAEVVY